MYRKFDQVATEASEFELANDCKLAEDNRWVMMAKVIPWSEFEAEYAENFLSEMGPPAFIISAGIGCINHQRKTRY